MSHNFMAESLSAVIWEPKKIKSFTDIYILLKIILLILEWSIIMFLKSVTSYLLVVTVDPRKLCIRKLIILSILDNHINSKLL